MSYKDKNGVWVIPQEQVIEFHRGDIDYRKLCKKCLVSLKTRGFSITTSGTGDSYKASAKNNFNSSYMRPNKRY
jgi:hypothetical protein